jgi:hypothetical protein
VKRLLHGTATNLYEQMELENESIADVARTADAQEGIAAFLAKRLLQFNGRWRQRLTKGLGTAKLPTFRRNRRSGGFRSEFYDRRFRNRFKESSR